MKAYPLHFPEKAPQGTKQGAKSPEGLTQGREIGIFLAFSRFPASITRIEQTLRRRPLYPAELRGHNYNILAQRAAGVNDRRRGAPDVSGARARPGGGAGERHRGPPVPGIRRGVFPAADMFLRSGQILSARRRLSSTFTIYFRIQLKRNSLSPVQYRVQTVQVA